jgi:hypothetical protein
MSVKLKESWIVQAFQHQENDHCEGSQCFKNYEDALEYANEWAEQVPYDDDTEHEIVIFKAVATLRGTSHNIDLSLGDEGWVENDVKMHHVESKESSPAVQEAWNAYQVLQVLTEPQTT